MNVNFPQIPPQANKVMTSMATKAAAAVMEPAGKAIGSLFSAAQKGQLCECLKGMASSMVATCMSSAKTALTGLMGEQKPQVTLVSVPSSPPAAEHVPVEADHGRDAMISGNDIRAEKRTTVGFIAHNVAEKMDGATEQIETAKTTFEIVSAGMGAVMEHAGPLLGDAMHGLGVGLGIVSIANGLRELKSSALAFNRSLNMGSAAMKGELIGLKAAAVGIDGDHHGAKEIDNLMKDLDFCKDCNKAKAGETGKKGMMDLACGITNATLALTTHGVAAVVTPIILFVVSTGAKESIAQRSEQKDAQIALDKSGKPIPKLDHHGKPEMDKDGKAINLTVGQRREQVLDRLLEGLDSLKARVNAYNHTNGEVGLSASDKAMMVALKTAGLLPHGVDVNKELSAATMSKIMGIKPQHVEYKFGLEGPEASRSTKMEKGLNQLSKNADMVMKDIGEAAQMIKRDATIIGTSISNAIEG